MISCCEKKEESLLRTLPPAREHSSSAKDIYFGRTRDVLGAGLIACFRGCCGKGPKTRRGGKHVPATKLVNFVYYHRLRAVEGRVSQSYRTHAARQVLYSFWINLFYLKYVARSASFQSASAVSPVAGITGKADGRR
jgi:hypothetical protein